MPTPRILELVDFPDPITLRLIPNGRVESRIFRSGLEVRVPSLMDVRLRLSLPEASTFLLDNGDRTQTFEFRGISGTRTLPFDWQIRGPQNSDIVKIRFTLTASDLNDLSKNERKNRTVDLQEE